MKSLVSNLHEVAVGILTDAQLAYPLLYREFERDKRSFSRYSIERGLGFFTLDLPALESQLVAGLESGRLSLTGPFSSRVSARIQSPKLCRGLWLRVFDRSGFLVTDPDPTAIDFLRNIFTLGKKVVTSCTAARNAAAIKEFVDVENSLPAPSLRWESDDLFDWADVRGVSFANYPSSMQYGPSSSTLDLFDRDTRELSEEDSNLLERLDSICRDVSAAIGLYDPVAFELSRAANGRAAGTKNGPGAVSDLKRGEEKFSFRNWPDKLQNVFPIDFFGHRPEEQGNHFVNQEHASRLIAVPKTAKTPRLIASEPSYHQWCQQSVRAFLEDAIDRTGLDDFISFKNQGASHPLVELGSLDGSLATVDLSSASDRLSCRVIERMFRSNLSVLHALHATRTRVIGPSERVDIEPTLLRKFSTMGSALTFPIQSLFFLCVALASLPGRPRLKSQHRRYRGRVRVYGDDIIIPVDGYDRLVRLLTLLDLKVNLSKSFSRGAFRESCGLDMYRGYDVTPVKPRSLDATTPEGRMSIVELANNLFRKGMWQASWRAWALLPEATLRDLPVVGPHSGLLGLVSFCGSNADGLKRRYNANLQRDEVLITSYTSKTETTRSDNTDYTLQALHSLNQRGRLLPLDSSRSELGRVVKAVTRERRSWEVLSRVLCDTSNLTDRRVVRRVHV